MENRARKIFSLMMCALALPGHAADPVTIRASAVEVLEGSATLFSHESVFLGMSCKSGPVGELSALRTVRVGDKISLGKYSFRVGVIEVTKHSQDVQVGGKTIAKAGDVECVMAADEKTLPYGDKCNALWVRAAKCGLLN